MAVADATGDAKNDWIELLENQFFFWLYFVILFRRNLIVNRHSSVACPIRMDRYNYIAQHKGHSRPMKLTERTLATEMCDGDGCDSVTASRSHSYTAHQEFSFSLYLNVCLDSLHPDNGNLLRHTAIRFSIHNRNKWRIHMRTHRNTCSGHVDWRRDSQVTYSCSLSLSLFLFMAVSLASCCRRIVCQHHRTNNIRQSDCHLLFMYCNLHASDFQVQSGRCNSIVV